MPPACPPVLQRAGGDSDSDDGMSDDSDDEDESAQLHVRKVAHNGGVNRVRAMPQQPQIVAAWSETAQVGVWDVAQQVCACMGVWDSAVPCSDGWVWCVRA